MNIPQNWQKIDYKSFALVWKEFPENGILVKILVPKIFQFNTAQKNE